jgi:hypothetical protein
MLERQKTRTVKASGFFIASLNGMSPFRASSLASQLLQGFALLTKSSDTAGHCRSWLASEGGILYAANLTEETQLPDSPPKPNAAHG